MIISWFERCKLKQKSFIALASGMNKRVSPLLGMNRGKQDKKKVRNEKKIYKNNRDLGSFIAEGGINFVQYICRI